MTDQPPVQQDVPEVVPDKHLTNEVIPDSPPESAPEPGAPVFIEIPVQHTGSIRAKPAGRKGRVRAPVKAARPAAGSIPRYPVVTLVSALRSLILSFAAAVLAATIFMWWTSPDFLPVQARKELAPVQATAQRVAVKPTALPTPVWFNRIGIVAGHSGLNRAGVPDPGAVCPDGFNELTTTTNTAAQLAALLRGRGFTVDVLEEFDPRRVGYQGAAYIALHADSCEDFGYGGFKTSYPVDRFTAREADTRLNECLVQNYGAITGLEFQPGNITINMTQYHHWNTIAPTTPAVILELGFLSFDRDLLQNQPDKLALGIMNGLMCFLNPALPQ